MKKRFIIAIFSFAIVSIVLCFVFYNFVLFPSKYKEYVDKYASAYLLDSSFVFAIIKAESNFNCDVKSKSGAIGLMQLMPTTASWISTELGETFDYENLNNPELNIKYGCFYLNYLMKKFDDKDVVICAYNAGESVVLNWIENEKINKSKINFPETKKYLERVNYYYNIYQSKQI